jgi:hypothetical protein
MFSKLKLPYLFFILTFVLPACNEGGDRSIINMADKGSGSMFGVIAVTLLVLFFIVAYFLDRRGKNKKKGLPKDGSGSV